MNNSSKNYQQTPNKTSEISHKGDGCCSEELLYLHLKTPPPHQHLHPPSAANPIESKGAIKIPSCHKKPLRMWMWGRHEKEHNSGADRLSGLPPPSASLARPRGNAPQTWNNFTFTASICTSGLTGVLADAVKTSYDICLLHSRKFGNSK